MMEQGEIEASPDVVYVGEDESDESEYDSRRVVKNRSLAPPATSLTPIFIVDKPLYVEQTSINIGLSIVMKKGYLRLIEFVWNSKYLLIVEFPSCMCHNQSLFHVSNFVDLTLVTDCPSAR